MSGCMQIGKPLISILMAVYEPNMQWLREQLLSLNAQTYPNLVLHILDDCSPTVPFTTIQSCVQDCISAFPYTLEQNEENHGSNKTFEKLTLQATGEYIAYCDQDDVWMPDKLTVLQREMTEKQSLLACSDMYIIDGNACVMADSITKVRRHHVFRSGAGLAEGLLMHNFVTGCTILVDAREAKMAVPFCPDMVHDHYLALWCAEKGTILSLLQPKIRYRIHNGNQTSLMSGVCDKASYGRVRIDFVLRRMEWLRAHFPCSAELHRTIDEEILWLQARQRNWNHQGGGAIVWKYRRFSPLSSVAELILKHMPEKIFMKAIWLVQRNQI